jgi:hypothetical protein
MRKHVFYKWGKFHLAKGDCSDQVHLDQMVLRTVRQEAGPRERWSKTLKTTIAQEGPSGSNPLSSDGSHDDQAGGLTVLMVAKGIQRQSWITHSLKKGQLTLSQGKIKKGDDVVIDDDDDAVRTVVS